MVSLVDNTYNFWYLQHLECNAHNQCEDDKECRNGKCTDPCDAYKELCTENEWCKVTNHVPSCSSKNDSVSILIFRGDTLSTYARRQFKYDCFVNLDECETTTCRTSSSGHKSCEMCQFPFKYKGITYNNCTNVDQDGYWCSTRTYPNGKHKTGFWGLCQNYCLKGILEYLE